jgi:signal transduction histidine kinase
LELLAPHLQVKAEIATELWVQENYDLFTQVLQNLLSNAIKYNLPEGWIKINTKHQETTILVIISNSSANILPSDRERIFDRFHRGNPARMRKIAGIGLGLSLAREITLAHGGKLTLDFTLPNQTSFTMSLPKKSSVIRTKVLTTHVVLY